jgi:DNA ligase (NAD+)
MKERIRHFSSRKAMDIEGFGEMLSDQLVEKGLVKGFSDIYSLTLDDLMQLERMGRVLGAKLLTAIEKSKTRQLPQLLYALGIRHVGEHIAEVLARSFHSVERLKAVKKEELTEIREIGSEIAEEIVDFFSQQENLEALQKLQDRGVKMEEEPGMMTAVSTGPLQGKTYLLTGTLSAMGRAEAEGLIKSLGGTMASSVSKRLDCLVTGDKPGSKLEKARQLGVEIIDEEKFLEITGYDKAKTGHMDR